MVITFYQKWGLFSIIFLQPVKFVIKEHKASCHGLCGTFVNNLGVYISNEKDDEYYIGNIILYDSDERVNGIVSKYNIIDGQQRITSILIILLAIYSVSIDEGADLSDFTIIAIRDKIWKREARRNSKEKPTMTLKSIERECFKAILEDV